MVNFMNTTLEREPSHIQPDEKEARIPIPSAAELLQLPQDGGSEFNRLVFEKSPYLLQHAANPVDWHPWGEGAFQKAKETDKPIFLSIGYSTCHWCHVMEHESFEDPQVAALINETFIPIKVDREERPDIDRIYMSVSQALTGTGGWPLTIILTPGKQPFFAGTYSISIVVIITFIVGILFGMLCMTVFVFRIVNDRRTLRRALRMSESEVTSLRNLPLSDAD